MHFDSNCKETQIRKSRNFFRLPEGVVGVVSSLALFPFLPLGDAPFLPEGLLDLPPLLPLAVLFPPLSCSGSATFGWSSAVSDAVSMLT